MKKMYLSVQVGFDKLLVPCYSKLTSFSLRWYFPTHIRTWKQYAFLKLLFSAFFSTSLKTEIGFLISTRHYESHKIQIFINITQATIEVPKQALPTFTKKKRCWFLKWLGLGVMIHTIHVLLKLKWGGTLLSFCQTSHN